MRRPELGAREQWQSLELFFLGRESKPEKVMEAAEGQEREKNEL